MSRHFLALGSISLLLLSALALRGEPEPDRVKKGAADWWGRIAAIQKDRDAKLDVLFKEMREQDAELKILMNPAQAAALLGENQFKPAAEKLEGSLKALASKPKLLGMALIQLGGLYATMGDYDKAYPTVLQGWQTLKDYSATAPRDIWPLIDGSAAAGAILLQIEKPVDAAPCIEMGLALCEKPQQGISLEGTPLQARCLLVKAEWANVMEDHLTARKCSESALELLQRLYPRPTPPGKYPATLESAAGLNSLALALLQLEEEPRTFELLREAQMILEKLFPKGHPSLAVVYGNLAKLYLQRGQEADALEWINKSHNEYKRLFPPAQYKNSHPGLIAAMTSLGNMLAVAGRDKPALREKALKMHAEALQHCNKHYTSAHTNKIDALLSYGRSLRSAGRIVEAGQQFQDALKMAHKIYPQTSHPRGHPAVAKCMLHIGSIQARQGRYPAAKETLEQARATFLAFYRPDHPYLSPLSQYLGILALKTDDQRGARDAFTEALTLDQRQLRRYARIASEAEAISFASLRRNSYHGYLTVTQENADPAETYSLVWAAKSAVTRVLHERRAVLRQAEGTSPRWRERARELRATSALISHILLDGKADDSRQRKQLANLMEKEERSLRELEKDLPDYHRSAEMERGGPVELAKRLPEDAVFVDFVRYEDFLQGKERRNRYVAFIVTPGGKPERVDLGFAEPIQRAVKGWRKAVDGWDPAAPSEARELFAEAADKHAAELRRLVWKPIAKRFPTTGTRRIYLAPDGDLTCFPFAALPGETADSILLEHYTIAYVPHGPFLLDQLLHASSAAEDAGRFLTLGNVKFASYHALRGSVEASPSLRQSAQTPIILEGIEATPRNLCEALPRARFAHLATHGFFAQAALDAEHKRLDQTLREWQFESGPSLVGIGLGGRSPMSYTGLVLAGSDRDSEANPGRAILTGSTIAGLPLDGLQLVVLSACETGLGEYTAGEGVQALERAFHLAGCHNVIATLWRIDDTATQVLMEGFYRQLWKNKRSPLEALRLAQLEIYRHPERVPGVDPTSSHRTHVNLWAGFVHSGTGN